MQRHRRHHHHPHHRHRWGRPPFVHRGPRRRFNRGGSGGVGAVLRGWGNVKRVPVPRTSAVYVVGAAPPTLWTTDAPGGGREGEGQTASLLPATAESPSDPNPNPLPSPRQRPAVVSPDLQSGEGLSFDSNLEGSSAASLVRMFLNTDETFESLEDDREEGDSEMKGGSKLLKTFSRERSRFEGKEPIAEDACTDSEGPLCQDIFIEEEGDVEDPEGKNPEGQDPEGEGYFGAAVSLYVTVTAEPPSGPNPNPLPSPHKRPADSPDLQCRHAKRAEASSTLEGTGQRRRKSIDAPRKVPPWTKKVRLQGMRRQWNLRARAAQSYTQGVRRASGLPAWAEERKFNMQGLPWIANLPSRTN
jgi:hypothetical protein